MKVKTRTIVLAESPSTRVVLATFTIGADDHLTSTWHDAPYRREIEAVGVIGARKRYRLGDGRAFFDALAVAYANSSRIAVLES